MIRSVVPPAPAPLRRPTLQRRPRDWERPAPMLGHRMEMNQIEFWNKDGKIEPKDDMVKDVWKEWITETIDINFKCYCSKNWNNDMDVWIPNMFKCLDGLEMEEKMWCFMDIHSWRMGIFYDEFHGYSDLQSFHRWKRMFLIMTYVLIYRGWNL